MRRRWIAPVLLPVILAGGVACDGKDISDVEPDNGELTDELSMPAEPTLALENFPISAECGTCHVDHFNQWRTSMHAYAMTDPVYRAMVKVRQDDFDGLQDRFCLQCHSQVGTRGGDIVPNFSFEDLAPVTLEGVTCASCHKISSMARLNNAGHVIDEDGPIRGPIEDPIEAGFHQSEYSPLFEQAEFCAGCHDVIEVSGLNLERPYEEWSESPGRLEGQTCQTCHMPAYEGSAAPGAPVRTLHDHRWVGVDLPLAEGFMTDAERDELRGRVEALLATAASLDVQAASQVTAGEQLDVFVTVTNNIASHNFPTGSTFNRQAWIELTVTDAGGAVIYQTGDLDDNGDLRNFFSELDPYGDSDLITFGSHLVDATGTPEIYSWRAVERISTALSPRYDRTFTLFVPTPADVTGPLEITARLRFRAFGPFLLRALGLGDLADRLPIYDIDSRTLDVAVAP